MQDLYKSDTLFVPILHVFISTEPVQIASCAQSDFDTEVAISNTIPLN